MRPDFCKVEDIVAEPLSLLGCHGLLNKQRVSVSGDMKENQLLTM